MLNVTTQVKLIVKTGSDPMGDSLEQKMREAVHDLMANDAPNKQHIAAVETFVERKAAQLRAPIVEKINQIRSGKSGSGAA